MRRTLTVSLSALVPMLAALALVPSSQADPGDSFSRVWDRGAGGERYVALGDSFTSGPGIAPLRLPNNCVRSERNFPSLFAETLDGQLEGGLTAYTDASCGGAETKDLWAAQSLGQLTNDPQLDALDEDTTLVTFGTLGGNDIGLVQLANSCFFTACVPPAGTDPLAGKFAALATELVRGIAAARTAAPRADILVVGYGTYLPPGGCPATFAGALTPDEFDYVQSQIDRMSDTLAAAAADQGADFVDMREIPGSVEHTACAAPDQQWIRALETYDDGVTLHPSACGMDAMAQHLTRTLQGLRGQEQTPFDSSCVSAGPAGPSPSPSPDPTPTATPDPSPAPSATPSESAAPSPTATPSTSPSLAPTATPVPTATPTPVPGADRATRRAELRDQAKALRGKVSCRAGSARLRVRGATDHVATVRFTVGGRKVAVDREAPFTLVLPRGRTPRGQVVARSVLRDGDLQAKRAVRLARPRCLR